MVHKKKRAYWVKKMKKLLMIKIIDHNQNNQYYNIFIDKHQKNNNKNF